MSYKYFLYSQQQVNDRNSILDKMNKVFKPGTVIVGGSKKEFSALSDTPDIPRYNDTRLIAEGEISTFKYTSPGSVQKYNNEV